MKKNNLKKTNKKQRHIDEKRRKFTIHEQSAQGYKLTKISQLIHTWS